MKMRGKSFVNRMLIFSALGAIFLLFQNTYAAPLLPTTLATYYTTPRSAYYYAGETIIFDGAASHDNDFINGGYTPKWVWDFNYKTSESWATDPNKVTTTDTTITHSYSEDGTYTVAVVYYDNDGQAGNLYTMTITIGPRTTYYYLKDHLGSVRMTINAGGTVVSYDNFYPFGETMPGLSSNTAIADAKYKFIGVEQDVETGYLETGDRLYDPWRGQFNSPDPFSDLFPNLGSYTYGDDNPILYVDPSGDTIATYNGHKYWEIDPAVLVTPSNQREISFVGGVNNISRKGIRFIRQNEGLRLHPYGDQAGKATIGYGHRLYSNDAIELFTLYPITPDFAKWLNRRDIRGFVRQLNLLLEVPLNQSEYNAMMDFIFQYGPTELAKSTLLFDVNSGNSQDIRKAFLLYDKVREHGSLKFSRGVYNRRIRDANLYFSNNH